jgi:hypothetical protein
MSHTAIIQGAADLIGQADTQQQQALLIQDDTKQFNIAMLEATRLMDKGRAVEKNLTKLLDGEAQIG